MASGLAGVLSGRSCGDQALLASVAGVYRYFIAFVAKRCPTGLQDYYPLAFAMPKITYLLHTPEPTYMRPILAC